MASSEALARAWADRKSAKDDFSLAFLRGCSWRRTTHRLRWCWAGRRTLSIVPAIGERLECPLCSAETNPFYEDVVNLIVTCAAFTCASLRP